MGLATHLYLKIDSDIRGPMSANVLQKMFKNKEVDSSAEFSFDGSKWTSITKLFSSKLKPSAGSMEKHPGNRNKKQKKDSSTIINTNIAELPELLKKTQRASAILNRTFAAVTYGIFALSSIIASSLLITLVQFLLPGYAPLLQVAFSIIPSMLIAAVITHSCGNIYISKITRLNKNQKYSLAVHMPWNRAPAEWSASLKNWLYCNDWLVENDSGDLLPYIRVFTTGAAPQTINEEVNLWQHIMQGSKKGFESVIGHSVRELACIEKLPAWTNEITPGMNLAELEKSLGSAGRKWALSLLKRAASRREELANIDLNGDLHDAIFEFHSSKLADGRKFLMVIIRESKFSSNNKPRSSFRKPHKENAA